MSALCGWTGAVATEDVTARARDALARACRRARAVPAQRCSRHRSARWSRSTASSRSRRARRVPCFFYAQAGKAALIIDDRYNGGGFIPDRMIEYFGRRPLAWWARRGIEPVRTPGFAHNGPKAMLVNGYSSSGVALAGEDWTVGASAKQFKFDADDPATWTASGGGISLIKGAVIFASGTSAGNRYLLCYASLSTAAFTLADGNTLTIQFNASGIFTMV